MLFLSTIELLVDNFQNFSVFVLMWYGVVLFLIFLERLFLLNSLVTPNLSLKMKIVSDNGA